MSKELEEPLELGADVPPVESPYAHETITPIRHIKISAYWFGTNFLWGALLTIMLPNEIKHIAPSIRVPALGVFTALAAVVALAVPLLVGAMSDRCAHALGRRRPYVITGVAINLIGLFLMDLAYKNAPVITAKFTGGGHTGEILSLLLTNPGFISFLVAYMVVQFGNNVATAAYSGFIPDLIPHEQRGVASGYMALMSQGGTLLGAVLCGMVFGSQTETVKYMLISTVLAAVAFVTVMGVRETPLPEKPPPLHWPTYVKSLWIDPKKYPDFAWVWITRALVMLGFYAVLPYINYYLIDVIGIEKPDAQAAKLIGIILLFSSIAGYVGGAISDRTGRKKVVYISNTLMAVIGLCFVVCRNFNEVLVVGVLFGIGYGAYISVDWALGTDVLPSKVEAGKEMAVWHIAMTLPQTIAALVAGILISAFGKTTTIMDGEPVEHYKVLGYGAVFLFAAACFGLGAFFLRNVKGVE